MKGKIIIFFVIIEIIYGNGLKCGNGIKNNKPMGIVKIKNESNKRLLNDEFEPMKIKVDYTQLKIDTKDNEDIFEIIKKSLDLAIHYFELLLSVKKADIEPASSETYKNYCDIGNVDSDCINWFTNYDLILLPSFDKNPEDKKVYASASACLLMVEGGVRKRPLAGRIYINNNYDYNKENIIVFLQTILFHEITHILVFDPNLLDKFGAIKREIIDNETRFYISSPLALEKARLHFGCDSLKGIPLEDQGDEGSAGSHWEGRYMLGDYMVSTNYHENVISDITLALFEDSGWYKPNYYTGGLFRFGKNQGCSFLEEKCVKNKKEGLETDFPNDFCLEDSKAFCGSSHIARGICVIREVEEDLEEDYQYFDDSNLGGGFSIANYCPVSSDFRTGNSFEKYYNNPNNCKNGLTIFSQYGEKIGDNSFCFESSLLPRYSLSNVVSTQNRSICYNIECDKFRKEIIIYIDSLKVYCPGNRTVLTNPEGFIGNILCPEYNLVCSSEVQCNDMLDCIIKNSTASRNTYLYLKSKIFEINFIFYLIIVLYFI
jgi:hypothetical protein